MPKLIMLKGLPGSGKSTWAKKEALKPNVKRVNKDDLRAMLDAGKWGNLYIPLINYYLYHCKKCGKFRKVRF